MVGRPSGQESFHALQVALIERELGSEHECFRIDLGQGLQQPLGFVDAAETTIALSQGQARPAVLRVGLHVSP
jgi:hypothetical protein